MVLVVGGNSVGNCRGVVVVAALLAMVVTLVVAVLVAVNVAEVVVEMLATVASVLVSDRNHRGCGGLGCYNGSDCR